MGRRDHDAGVAVVVTGSEAQRGNGHELVINTYVDSVCGQYACGVTCEIPALETAVVADRHGLRAALGEDPAGDALRCLADNPDIHAVRACAECAAKAGCTELKGYGKALLDGFIVACDALQFRVQIAIHKIGGGPAFVIIKIHSFFSIPERVCLCPYLRRSMTDMSAKSTVFAQNCRILL